MKVEEHELLPIGRFALVAGLTVRALRHYDDIGLLRPDYVDPGTGYRYYRLAQLEDAAKIRRLRALGVPLEEIGDLLRADTALLRERLCAHRAHVAAAAAATAETLAALDLLIDGKEALVADVDIDIDLKEEPALRLAGVIRHVEEEAVPQSLHEMIIAVHERLDQREAAVTGPPVGIFRSGDGAGSHLLEVGFPVGEDVDADSIIGVHVYASSRAATHDYRGSWREFPEESQRFIAAVAQRGLHPCQPIRVVYPTLAELPRIPDSNWRARLVWPIR